jgi:hypothetical protein
MTQKTDPCATAADFYRFFLGYTIFKTNLRVVTYICFGLALLLIALDVVVIFLSGDLVDIRVDINRGCFLNRCTFLIHLEKDSIRPLYFFVGYDQFFLNSRKAIIGFDATQMSGRASSTSEVWSTCDDFKTLKQGREYFPDLLPDRPEADPLVPCGQFPLLYSQCRLTR